VVNRNLFQRVLSLIYPERCCCCAKPIVCGKLVCDACYPGLVQILPPFCPECGLNKQDCSCKGHQRFTDGCASPFYHEKSAKSALHLLKFAGKTYGAELFSLYMAGLIKQAFGDVKFDCVTSVPLSSAVLQKRRYNQSLIIAKGLAGRLKVPYKELLIKKFETTPQRQLPAYQRSGNVLGVFDVLPKAAEFIESEGCKTVLLVDDTVTTGATINECAKMLKLYGVERVYAVTATASRLKDRDR